MVWLPALGLLLVGCLAGFLVLSAPTESVVFRNRSATRVQVFEVDDAGKSHRVLDLAPGDEQRRGYRFTSIEAIRDHLLARDPDGSRVYCIAVGDRDNARLETQRWAVEFSPKGRLCSEALRER